MMTDPSFFHPILKACHTLSSFKHANSVHAYVIKNGLFESYPSLQNSLMDFYIKSGSFQSATSVFEGMKVRDTISWNIMISGYLNQAGCYEKGLILFNEARGTGTFEPNVATLVLLVQACRAINDGLKIHGYVIKSGYCTVSSVQNSLLSFYAANVGISVARILFDQMLDRDVVSWSVMIGGYVQDEEPHVALCLFNEMVSGFGIEVDAQLMVSVLQACTSIEELSVGRLAHGFVIRKGMIFDLFVGNSLIDMYSKCRDTVSADQVFSEMTLKNLVSWNSLLSGLVHDKKHVEAISLFDSMSKDGIQVDEVTLVSVLQICKYHLDQLLCKSIHCAVLRRGYELNKLVINSLVDVYAKCDLITIAWALFCQMTEQDTVTWSTMIAGFTNCGMLEEAFAVYEKMILAECNPNAVTMLNLIEACSTSGEIERSKWAHGIVIRRGFSSEVAVGTAILDMYSKCGEIETSRKVFDQISSKSTVSWSAMIAAYGMNSRAQDALSLFTELKSQGLKPNQVTIISLLSACSHGGLVEEGISLFEELVQDHDIELTVEHYSCMVDLLGRAGKLDRAMELIDAMPDNLKPSASAWGALLSACRRYGNSELGVEAVSRVLELEPSNSAGYMLASSMYATEGLWVDAARMRALVKERGVKVVAGHSLVHVNNRVVTFVAGDKKHPLSDEIWLLVELLHEFMRLDNRNNEFILNS